jgi:hypothetical protein
MLSTLILAIKKLIMNVNLKKGCLTFLAAMILTACDKVDDPTTSTTGAIVFWTPNIETHGGFVDITIHDLTRTITANWASPPSNCVSTNGVAYFVLEEGTHTYSTVDFFGYTSTGSVTAVGNHCINKRLE